MILSLVRGPADTAERAAGWVSFWQQIAEALSATGDEVGRVAAGQGFVISRQQVRAAGIADAEVRRRLRSGTWSVPRRGWLSPLPRDSDPDVQRALAAASAALARHACVSHDSAALLHGLPSLRVSDRVQLTVPSVSHGGGWPDCVVHAAPSDPDERQTWFGVPILSPTRTVTDVARRHGVAAGLVTADAALQLCTVSEASLEGSLIRGRRRPGMSAARRAVELARPGAESPLESLVRHVLVDGGVPAPIELQAQVRTDRRTYRVDLLLDRRVVVEADGRWKYRSAEAVWDEKLRQDALHRAGLHVVRVTWSDVWNRPESVVAEVARALRRATGTRRPA